MTTAYGQLAVDSLMTNYSLLPLLPQYHHKWSYDIGVTLQGVKQAYQQTHDQKLLTYIKATIDEYVDEQGGIRNYQPEQLNSDAINNGKLLLFLYRETQENKYRLAADRLYQQIQQMPRTPEGGFWHKKIYPEQMWLDGLYMVEPFYAEYCLMFDHESQLTDVIKQFQLSYQHTHDEKTGLLYHAWNADKQQPWADPVTGQSPHFWGRAMGWYCMALVDTYELLHEKFPAEAAVLKKIFVPVMNAVRRVQDPQHGVWYQVLDQGQRRGNYLEASVSAMFVYALARGVQLGMLPAKWQSLAEDAYQHLLTEFVFMTKEGQLNLIRNCQVAGLGGGEHRDGSFVYYISEPIITNDFKGYGAFIQAALAVEHLTRSANRK